MSPTYTIEGLDWLGWLGLALMIAAVIATWIWFRHRKASGGFDNKLTGPYPIDGFADCHYPEDLNGWKSTLFHLVSIRDDVFRYCELEYDNTARWIVPKVTLIRGTPHKKHPNVMWSRAGDRIVLKIQDDMHWHFAGECHNVFRFGLHGKGSDKQTYGDDDYKAAMNIRNWIAERYKDA